MLRGVLAALVVLIAIAGITGCDTEAKKEAANTAIVIEAFDALNNKDYGTLDQFIAPDYRRHCQATPDARVESIDDFIALAKEWDATFPDANMTLHFTAAEGDLVAFWGTFSGTQEGPMGPFPATGKRMSSETAGFHRIEDGKIAETWVTWDNMAALAQLGLLPLPSGPPAEANEATSD